MRAWIKVIDTKSGQLIFNDSIRGYIKYWYAYQTEQRRQVTFKTDSEMEADLGQTPFASNSTCLRSDWNARNKGRRGIEDADRGIEGESRYNPMGLVLNSA